MPGYEKQPSTILRIYGYLTDVTSLEEPILAHQPSQHPFLAFIQKPTTARTAVQRLIYLICP